MCLGDRWIAAWHDHGHLIHSSRITCSTTMSAPETDTSNKAIMAVRLPLRGPLIYLFLSLALLPLPSCRLILLRRSLFRRRIRSNFWRRFPRCAISLSRTSPRTTVSTRPRCAIAWCA
jgi:hypothetical protein